MTVVPATALRSVAACCVLLILGGCATTGAKNPADPWEPGSRKVFAFGRDGALRRPRHKRAQSYGGFTAGVIAAR